MQSTRPPLVFRGSRRRLRHIRMRANWSVEMTWLLVGVMLGAWLALRLVRTQSIEPGLRQQSATSAVDDPNSIHRR